MESLTAQHISSNLANYEAARNAFFTLIVDDLSNLVSPDFTGDSSTASDGDRIPERVAQEVLKLNVIKCPVPHFSLKTEEYRRGNEVVKFATTPEWDSGTIVVDDIVGQDTKSLLQSWFYLGYNPNTRKGGRMKDYKKRCTLCEYTQDYELIRTWTLEGCFITKLEEDDFDRENDGKRQIRATLSYDRATVALPKAYEFAE